MNWYSGLKAKILFNEPLSRHTTLRVGTNARLWVEPYDVEALRSLLLKAKAQREDYLVIGSGSKLLIKKKKFPLVIHLGATAFKRCIKRHNDIIAGAGVSLGRLIGFASKHNLGGLEFLQGIPATVGGALVLNAGAAWPKRMEIGSFAEQVKVMDKSGSIKILDRKVLEFGYRNSNLKEYIILSARFRLSKKKKEDIESAMQKFREHRLKTQEIGGFTCGSIFKNPHAQSSGRLIDLCGLKGRRIGDALISNKHANFIINLGNASSNDVLALMHLAQDEVRKRFKINLEPELQVV